MKPTIASGADMAAMGAAIARELGAPLCKTTSERFPDGEMHVVVKEDLAGRRVALIQSLVPPIGERLLELALLADACRRAGAEELHAVLPYFAYARQDQCKEPGEALGGEVMARLVSVGGFRRVFAVDLHSDAAPGWFRESVTHLTAAPALLDAARPSLAGAPVVVSPDLGGAKRAERIARALGAPLAIVHKIRRSGHEVAVHEVLGDVRGRAILLVDDIISTGGTIEAAASALRRAQCSDDITVLATHALLVGNAVERLAAARIRRLVHTDSVPFPAALPFEHVVVPLAPLLAGALRALPG